MTYVEAIKHFKSLQKRYTKEHNGRMCEKVNLALEALEKQVPKKAPNHDGMVCPSCNSKARYGHPYEYYCPHCGQAIDWSDDE